MCSMLRALAVASALWAVRAQPADAADLIAPAGEESVAYGDGLHISWALERKRLRLRVFVLEPELANGTATLPAGASHQPKLVPRFVSDKLLSGAWLRERCQCEGCVDEGSGQPLHDYHDSAHFPSDLEVAYVGLLQERGQSFGEPSLESQRNMFGNMVSGASLVVRLSSAEEPLAGAGCEFGIRFLVDELLGGKGVLQADPIKYPQPRLWTAVSLAWPPVFDYKDLTVDGRSRDKFISQLLITGLVLVDDCPRRPGLVVEFAKSVSTLRDTEWGDTFNVRTVPDVHDVVKKDLAYTPLGIGMHTDNPYRDPMPDFQLLHQIEGCECPDGHYPCAPKCHVDNFFSDGFAAALHLKKQDPAMFKILTEIPVRWENNGGDRSKGGLLVTNAPHIELQTNSAACMHEECLLGIRFSAKSGGYSPHIDDPQREELFFRARREFSRLLASDEFRIRLNNRPGQMVVFDNRRILHGRGFIQSDVPRWVQGAYMNRDGLWYEFAKGQRRANPSAADFASTATLGPLEGLMSFSELKGASKANFDWIGKMYGHHVDSFVMQRMLGMLKEQEGKNLGQPVDLFEHGLQTASRAYRAGEPEDIVVMSLLHDMTETIASKNHGGVAASFLEPYITEKAAWMLAHHEIFQGFYYFHHVGGNPNERDRYKDHQWYGELVRWCEEYDQKSFDAMYPNLPLSFFLPMVEHVFNKVPYWWDTTHPKHAAVTGVKSSEPALPGSGEALAV